MAIIKPAQGLNPDVNQIYPIVNALFQQMTGRTDIQAVDTTSLIAMGNEIGNLGKYDLWLNTLARRIAFTIDGYRVYRNKFSDLYRTQIEWGAMVQKITAEMPEAVADVSYDIGKMDGQAVDHYIISNPKVKQRIFDKETPYSFFITMSTKLLKDAFLSSGAMSALVNQIFGKVRNKIEFVLEELGRIAVANLVINMQPAQHYHLVTMYNGTSPKNTVTPASARYDADFLRWAIGFMNNVAVKMETMSVQYNADGFDRFTPAEDRRFYVLSDFMTMLETVVMYEAFNPKYVTSAPDIRVPYWQAGKKDENKIDWGNISSVSGTVASAKGSIEKTVSNLIGIMFDREAVGTFREEEEVLTTPVNARGAYYNTFWHERQLWFNDMSENAVAFFLD